MQAVLEDPATSPLDEKHRALFSFIDAVNRESVGLRSADAEAMRSIGWTDEELYFAITVCALFNFYNRWIDACGVQAMSDEAHQEGGRRSAVHGYVR